MEAYGLEISVASENLCMSPQLVSQLADFQCIDDFLLDHIVKIVAFWRSGDRTVPLN